MLTPFAIRVTTQSDEIDEVKLFLECYHDEFSKFIALKVLQTNHEMNYSFEHFYIRSKDDLLSEIK